MEFLAQTFLVKNKKLNFITLGLLARESKKLNQGERVRRPKPDDQMRRDWRKYSKESLSGMLAEISWRTGVEGVQQYWNIFENLCNLLCNRFKPLNNKIDYSWLNESLNTFKVKCKKLLLQTV